MSEEQRKEEPSRTIEITLLTGGIDRPYTFGLAMELISKGVELELIGSEGVDFPEFHCTPGLRFLDLQGSQKEDVPAITKILRLARYYARLMWYTMAARPKIFHVLWNGRLEEFDRTCLMLFYRLLGKKVVRTVHNVNKKKRDGTDTRLNRFTLRMQYQLSQYIFVHTERMKVELIEEFGVDASRVQVIPFGINNAVPNTGLTQAAARERLGIAPGKKTILFFGRITRYKGVRYLAEAFERISTQDADYQLVICGRPENDYRKEWTEIEDRIQGLVASGQILLKAEHIPDEDTEVYFKAADALVLPYQQIYQSGVLFLGYSFGLPILAADVGTLREEIIPGETGFLFKPENVRDLSEAIHRYFGSDLYRNLEQRRAQIVEFAKRQHSWDVVGELTVQVYRQLLRTA